MVCLTLANFVLDKFGGDSLTELIDNLARHRERIAKRPASAAGTGRAASHGAAPAESE
jgi:hypothetical protein